MAQNVRIREKTNYMLKKLSEKRKKEEAFAWSKQDIVDEAVSFLFKKEIRQSKAGDYEQ